MIIIPLIPRVLVFLTARNLIALVTSSEENENKKIIRNKMKKTAILLGLIMGLQTASLAQITITSSDMPVAGDTIRTSVSMDFLNF